MNEQLAAYAAELVQLPVDLIVALAAFAIEAAMKATNRIPIVMVPGTDPVEQGFIASLARPGGNVTGVGLLQRALAVKRLQLLTQVLPAVSQVDVLFNATPGLLAQMQGVEAEASRLGVQIRRLVASTTGELDAVLAETATDPADAVYAMPSPFINTNKDRILAWAAARRAPVIHDNRDWATAGALVTYGWDAWQGYRRAAVYVDMILKGANPAEMPVELPTRYDLVINLRTARALGLTIPPAVLAPATEVIQ